MDNEGMNKKLLSIALSVLLVSCGGTSQASSETISSPSDTISSTQEQISSQIEETSQKQAILDNHQIYDGYYADLVSWTDGEDLKKQLHDIVHGGTYSPLEYTRSNVANWQSNQNADVSIDDFEYLDVVYSGSHVRLEDTNTSWQREHAFCASLMTGSTTGNAVKTLGRATDFHNLFASNSSGNSSRGNKNFGIANKEEATYQSRLDSENDGYSFDNKNFEPSDKDKGRLSRAIFYMATMYSEEEYDEANGIMMKPLTIVEEYVPYVTGEDCAFAHGNLSALLEWSKGEVDILEYQHNESVYSYVPAIHSDPSLDHAQGNRNPYVDFPELVDYVYGEKKNTPGTLDEVISSHETLGKYKEGVERYAIGSALRKYAVGDLYKKEDINIYAISFDGSKEEYADFTTPGRSFDVAFETSGKFKIAIKTPINMIFYSVDVVKEDPLSLAQYQHQLTAKSSGQDFANCYNNAGVENRLTLSSVEWDVYWQEGEVASNSAAFGCKFGKNASSPVKTLRFTSASAFEYDSLDLIKGIYVSGSAASGCAYPLKMYVGNEQIYSGTMGYLDQQTKKECYGKLAEPKQGQIKIEITNITNAVYIHTLAVILETAE